MFSFVSASLGRFGVGRTLAIGFDLTVTLSDVVERTCTRSLLCGCRGIGWGIGHDRVLSASALTGLTFVADLLRC